MSGHTPGPWSAETCSFGAFDITAEKTFGGCIVICSRSRHMTRSDEMHANARLIAAAPDLLALARQYASECAECDGKGYYFEGEAITGRGPDDVFPEQVACPNANPSAPSSRGPPNDTR